MKVYARIDGALATWEVGAPHPLTAILTAAMSIDENRLVSHSRWTAGTFLAVIEGGKSERAEVAA